jgi:rRNA processing protein Gar1
LPETLLGKKTHIRIIFESHNKSTPWLQIEDVFVLTHINCQKSIEDDVGEVKYVFGKRKKVFFLVKMIT